jgi:DNA-binding response OmpR family regulator
MIIAITAYVLNGDREKCLEAGMDGYLAKPIWLDELRKAIETWLDWLNEITVVHRCIMLQVGYEEATGRTISPQILNSCTEIYCCSYPGGNERINRTKIELKD